MRLCASLYMMCARIYMYDRVKEVIRHGLHKDMYKCVCVRVYLLNTDKSSLSLRVSTPPIVITTAAPRHDSRHYRTVLVPPLFLAKKKLATV